jgi:hypothetical protein
MKIKLNHTQAFNIIHFLVENGFIWTYPATTIGKLFDGLIEEAQIISLYGMAGKLWNNNGRIYITGHNDAGLAQIGKEAARIERTQIEEANSEIATIIEMYKD